MRVECVIHGVKYIIEVSDAENVAGVNVEELQKCVADSMARYTTAELAKRLKRAKCTIANARRKLIYYYGGIGGFPGLPKLNDVYNALCDDETADLYKEKKTMSKNETIKLESKDGKVHAVIDSGDVAKCAEIGIDVVAEMQSMIDGESQCELPGNAAHS